jgi:hypothetical protein
MTSVTSAILVALKMVVPLIVKDVIVIAMRRAMKTANVKKQKIVRDPMVTIVKCAIPTVAGNPVVIAAVIP